MPRVGPPRATRAPACEHARELEQPRGRARTWRPAAHVEPGALDRVERGVAAGEERGDCEPLPAAQRVDQRRAFAQQRPSTLDLERDRTPHALRLARAAVGDERAQVLVRGAEAREILGGYVEAPGSDVLGDVLQMLGELQRGADGV